MIYRHFSLIASFILLIGIAAFWYDDPGLTAPPVAKHAIQKGAEYFLQEGVIREYDLTGKLDYQLVSKEISYYKEDDVAILQQPYLISFSPNGDVATAVSDSGKLLSAGNEVELWDNVVLDHNPAQEAGDADMVRMNTDFITFYLKQSKAETDRHVLVTSREGTTSAIGMTAFYKQGFVQLKSDVRGIYEAFQ